jgi:integrase/recombinase XerD
MNTAFPSKNISSARRTVHQFLVTPLRQRMLEDLQIRHYSPTTIRIYLRVIAEFARHFSKPPDQLDAGHIRCYQVFLIKEKRVSQSTYIQTVCALRFFYTHTLSRKIAIERMPFPRRERKLPLILSREDVKALLEAPHNLRQRTCKDRYALTHPGRMPVSRIKLQYRSS